MKINILMISGRKNQNVIASSSRRILGSGHLFGHWALLTLRVKVDQFYEINIIEIMTRKKITLIENVHLAD